MIKMEVARRAQPSHAHRPLTAEEYEQLIEQLGSVEVVQGAWLCAYFAFQVTLTARVDDTAELRSFFVLGTSITASL